MTSRYNDDGKIERCVTIPPLHQLNTHVECTHTYEKEKSVSISNDLIAGGIGGIAGIIVGHPFDSIKVRYQMAAATTSTALEIGSTTISNIITISRDRCPDNDCSISERINIHDLWREFQSF